MTKTGSARGALAWRGLAGVVLALAAVAGPAAALDAVADKAAIDAEFAADWPRLEVLYKDIHSHPEIAFQETRTSALLAAQMRALGFEVTEHVGKTGIVALYRNGPGPVVRTANAEAAMSGAPAAQIDFTEGATAVVNDDALVARTEPVFKAAFGDQAVLEKLPGAASEDYSEFILAGVPSFYWSLGGYDPAKVAEAKRTGVPLPVNHSPYFAPVAEPSVRTGVEAMTLAVMNAMQG